jgi:hypothetical protein
MQQNRRAISWLRSAYLVYGFVFIGGLGGLIQVLVISDEINYALVKFLEINANGPELQGNYLFPRNWLALTIVLVFLMLIFAATVALRSFVEDDKEKSIEIIGLRQDINDTIRAVANITDYMHPHDGVWDVASVNVKHDVSENGNTLIESIYTIEPPLETGHYWNYWIEADTESDPVSLLRDLRSEVTDLDTGRKLDWLPRKNEDRFKEFSIFFPEVSCGTKKSIRISYVWPGYMRRLVELGATSFFWGYTSKTPDLRVPMRIEWSFSSASGNINCRILGRKSATASINTDRRTTKTVWIYDDPQAPINSKYSVEFTKN